MENRKNTILLTVIAVATLLVAVVGATFAYFTAQGGTTSQADVTVTTATADSAAFGTWTAINITADQSNFASGLGDRTGSSSGTVEFTASTAAAADFCYNVSLKVTKNEFVYSSTNTDNDPELTLTATKNGTNVIDGMDITTITVAENAVQIPTAKGGSTYEHKLSATAGNKVSDSWTLTVTLVNLDVDQQDNTGKSFEGAIKFTKVTCS